MTEETPDAAAQTARRGHRRTPLSIALLLVLLLVIGLVPLWQIARIGDQFYHLSDRDLPMGRAGQEMEINMTSVGLSTLAYVDTRQDIHLERIAANREDLERALERLQSLAHGERQHAIVDELDRRVADYLALSDELVATVQRRARLARRNRADLERMEATLERERGRDPASGDGNRPDRARALREMEVSLGGMMSGFLKNLDQPGETHRERMAREQADFAAALERMQALLPAAQRNGWLDDLARRYERFRTELTSRVELLGTLRTMETDFVAAREAIDRVTDERLQTALQEAVARSRADVNRATREAMIVQPALTLLGLGLALLVSGYLVRHERALRRKQEELVEANQYKSDFLANMSHEIRTPMNAVLGMTRLMERTELDEQQADYLAKIRRSSENLLGIINDILDFSRIEANKLEFEERVFDLDEVLSDVSNMAGLTAEEKGLELIYRLDPQVPLQLRGDPLRLGQVLLNLVNNAIKFTESGYVVLAVEPLADDGETVEVRFSVRDSGVGMDSEQQERLFEAFTQVDTSASRRFGGTGLGLAIVKHIVERMGSRLQVDSAPGKGSTFWFDLRLPHAVSGALTNAAADVPLKERHALVVDDVEVNRNVLTEILRSWKFTVEEAETAEQAIEKESEAADSGHPFSLILMDWKLPGMDGLAASERILEREAPGGPLVLMVTAHDRGGIHTRAREVGIPTVLKKPFTPSTLYNAITRAAEGPLVDTDDAAEEQRRVPSFPGARILVVEDNGINLQIVRELLEEKGAHVGAASNGRTGVERVRARDTDYDLVLMDAQMPEMDGYAATRELRADKAYRDLPIVAMTAHAMSGDREKCLDAGMNDYLPKPLDEIELFGTIARWLPADRVAWSDAEGTAVADDEGGEEEQLDGIDVEQGLQRVGGKRELFHRQLAVFRQKYARAAAELREELVQDRFEAAGEYAHAIKGAAGMLGASQVAAAAADLEQRFRGEAPGEQRDALERGIDAFAGELDRVFAAIDASAGEAGTADAPGGEWDAERVRTLLQTLARQLERNDLAAGNSVEALARCLEGHGHDERLEQLRAAVDRLEFRAAADRLAELARELDLEIDGD